MAIYYQHIGRDLWARDAPLSIVDQDRLIDFEFHDLEGSFTSLSPEELDHVRADLGGKSFQIWGLPSGAAKVLKHMVPGDHLMLLESEEFRYVGNVLHYMNEPSWDLSARIWGEQRFPLIVMLQGSAIHYPWVKFVRELGFAVNYHMRGNTCRIADERITSSRFGTERDFIKNLTAEAAQSPLEGGESKGSASVSP